MLEKATGKLVVLANQVSKESPLSPGIGIGYANDLDIAQDGTIFFTTSTDKPVLPNVESGFADTFRIFLLDTMQASHSLLCCAVVHYFNFNVSNIAVQGVYGHCVMCQALYYTLHHLARHLHNRIDAHQPESDSTQCLNRTGLGSHSQSSHIVMWAFDCGSTWAREAGVDSDKVA